MGQFHVLLGIGQSTLINAYNAACNVRGFKSPLCPFFFMLRIFFNTSYCTFRTLISNSWPILQTSVTFPAHASIEMYGVKFIFEYHKSGKVALAEPGFYYRGGQLNGRDTPSRVPTGPANACWFLVQMPEAKSSS